MKKTKILFTFLILICTSYLFADNVGPGLGRAFMSGNKGKGMELIAMTSNRSCATQYFAITSGTSGYQEGAIIGYNDAQHFLDENMDMVAQDMARGKGEYLDTFIELMELDGETDIQNKLSQNFDNIYTHEDITSGEIIINILKIQKSNS